MCTSVRGAVNGEVVPIGRDGGESGDISLAGSADQEPRVIHSEGLRPELFGALQDAIGVGVVIGPTLEWDVITHDVREQSAAEILRRPGVPASVGGDLQGIAPFSANPANSVNEGSWWS
jgi:hypothetical protein